VITATGSQLASATELRRVDFVFMLCVHRNLPEFVLAGWLDLMCSDPSQQIRV
jgi:hypothetical protein